MDFSGTVFRPNPRFIGAGIELHSNSRSNPSLSRKRIAKFPGSSGFSDKGHVQYYSESTRGIRCGSGMIDQATKPKDKSLSKDERKMIKKKKKSLKLVKGLFRDLSIFSDLGLGLDNHGSVDPVRGKMISEATELLLGQLQQLKTEEEVKSKRREEKAKMKAAARMQNRLECELSSSSSSSSSSESCQSECNEVVDMSSLENQSSLPPPVLNESLPVIEEAALQIGNTLTHEAIELQPVSSKAFTTLTIPSTMNQKGNLTEEGDRLIGTCLPCIEKLCFTTGTSTSTSRNVMGGGEASSSSAAATKLEVCMGGKCKKSGAAVLLDEFQRVLGSEGSVVGCKCMGKCKDGPNVRILNHSGVGVEAEYVDDSTRMPYGPLCIGVGFEDVGSIVAKFIGDKHKELGLGAVRKSLDTYQLGR